MGGGIATECERGEFLMPIRYTIVYYRNYSAADTASRSYTQSSATFTLKSVDETGWSAPDGYAFKEWNSLADGTGLGRDPGDTVTSYEWYAIWVQDTAYITTGSELASVADAIRTKGGTSAALTYPTGFVSAIQAIPTGGTTQTKTATPTKSVQFIRPDTGYDGLSLVTVNAIPSQYITPTGTITITENGTYDVTAYASVIVNVSSVETYDVTITLTNPVNPSNFHECVVYQQDSADLYPETQNHLGTIMSPTGSATYMVSMPYIQLEYRGTSVSAGTATCTGGVSLVVNEGSAEIYEVTGNGTIVSDGVDYND